MKPKREPVVKLAYTLEEAAETCGLSTDTLRRAVRSTDHKLPARRSGVDKKGQPAGKVLILHDDLVEWLRGLESA